VLTCLARASGEEDAVLFPADLREVGFRSRWIGFEVEAVSGFRRRRGRNRNPGWTLEEVASELVRLVAESPEAPGDAAPVDPQRVDDRAKNPERVRRIKAVGDGEHVEYGADIVDTQARGATTNVHVPAAGRVFRAPEDERAGQNPRVIRVGTKLAPNAVKSYESEGAVVLLIVQADKDAAHEAHVRVKVVGGALARVEVRAGARESQISLCDHTAEIRDDRGIAAGQWGGSGVGRRGRSIDMTREEEMRVDAGGVIDVRYGPGHSSTGAVLVLLLPMVGPCSSDFGAEHKPRPSTCCAAEEPAATQIAPGETRLRG